MQARRTAGPGFGELYIAGIVASGIVFAVALAFAGAMALVESSAEAAFGVVLVGGIYGLLFAGALAVFLIAPLGAILALVLIELVGPQSWLGAVVGAGLAGGVFGVILFGLAPAEAMANPQDLAGFAALVAVAGAAGWFAQRRVLRWP